MPVTTSPTMNEPTTTATARVAVLNDTHQQASSTELEDFYTTYYHLAPPPVNEVLPCCTGYHDYYALPVSPPHEAPGDPDDKEEAVQYPRDTTNRLAGSYDLTAGEFMIRRTNQCRSATPTKGAYANDRRARWFNTSNDTGNASRKYRKAHADSKAGTGEAYHMRDEGRPREEPRCASPPGVTGRACTSSGKARADEQRAAALPPSVRRYLAEDAGAEGEDTCKSVNKN
jgi:hypothetical protein